MQFDFEKMKQFGFSEEAVAKMKMQVAQKESETHSETYQWKYLKYVGKAVKLTLNDGQVLLGKVDSVSSPGDNDNEEEGIFLDTSIGIQEFFEHDIASIE